MSQSRQSAKKPSSVSSRTTAGRAQQTLIKHSSRPHDYAAVLSDLKQLIAVARRRALATVSRELVGLYWHIGRTIIQRQQQAAWGDAVVDQWSQDLRLALPDFAGLTSGSLWRVRKFYCSYDEIDEWLSGKVPVAALLPGDSPGRKLGTTCPENPSGNRRRPGPSDSAPPDCETPGTVSPQIASPELRHIIVERRVLCDETSARIAKSLGMTASSLQSSFKLSLVRLRRLLLADPRGRT